MIFSRESLLHRKLLRLGGNTFVPVTLLLIVIVETPYWCKGDEVSLTPQLRKIIDKDYMTKLGMKIFNLINWLLKHHGCTCFWYKHNAICDFKIVSFVFFLEYGKNFTILVSLSGFGSKWNPLVVYCY